MILKLKYRVRYYWRVLIHLMGYCPTCYNKVNYTRHGKPICPYCGK